MFNKERHTELATQLGELFKQIPAGKFSKEVFDHTLKIQSKMWDNERAVGELHKNLLTYHTRQEVLFNQAVAELPQVTNEAVVSLFKQITDDYVEKVYNDTSLRVTSEPAFMVTISQLRALVLISCRRVVDLKENTAAISTYRDYTNTWTSSK